MAHLHISRLKSGRLVWTLLLFNSFTWREPVRPSLIPRPTDSGAKLGLARRLAARHPTLFRRALLAAPVQTLQLSSSRSVLARRA